MTRVNIPRYRGSYHSPMQGTWAPVTLDNKATARIGCPGCGQAALLDHTVDENGDVNPSLLCDCGYHEYVHLCNWDG